MQNVTHEVDSIRTFGELGLDDVPLVGGKNASLGEMIRELTSVGVSVPDGFAVTADAYRWLLESAGLDALIRETLSDLDTSDVANLQQRGRIVRHAILAAPLPEALEQQIIEAYDRLGEGSPHPIDVAVRSSATAEDLPGASFAGQQETYLNVHGHRALIEACRRCFASLFTDRAISYRVDKGFDHFSVALSIGVQRMIRSDLACSGVMFSIDTETGFRDAVLINAAYGLGENVVQGTVNPDEYHVFKPTLAEGFRPILRRSLGSKDLKMVYDEGGSRAVKNVPVAPEACARFALTDDEVLQLARWAMIIEDHYSSKRGRLRRRWTWSGPRTVGRASCSSCRPGPETVRARSGTATHLDRSSHVAGQRGPLLVEGPEPSASGSAPGRVRIVQGRSRPRRRSRTGDVPRRGQDRPRLGAGSMKKAAGDRHEPRRSHVPTRRSSAGNSACPAVVGCAGCGTDNLDRTAVEDHGLLCRGRHGLASTRDELAFDIGSEIAI